MGAEGGAGHASAGGAVASPSAWLSACGCISTVTRFRSHTSKKQGSLQQRSLQRRRAGHIADERPGGLRRHFASCVFPRGSLNRYHHHGARFPRLDPWARILLMLNSRRCRHVCTKGWNTSSTRTNHTLRCGSRYAI